MSHGTTEIDPPIRDHTRDVLRAAFFAAHELALFARENVTDAERGLVLARFAAERAAERASNARAELLAYDARR